MTCTDKIRNLLTEVESCLNVGFAILTLLIMSWTQICLHTLFYSEIQSNKFTLIGLRKAFHIDFKLNSVFSLSNITYVFLFPAGHLPMVSVADTCVNV